RRASIEPKPGFRRATHQLGLAAGPSARCDRGGNARCPIALRQTARDVSGRQRRRRESAQDRIFARAFGDRSCRTRSMDARRARVAESSRDDYAGVAGAASAPTEYTTSPRLENDPGRAEYPAE